MVNVKPFLLNDHTIWLFEKKVINYRLKLIYHVIWSYAVFVIIMLNIPSDRDFMSRKRSIKYQL